MKSLPKTTAASAGCAWLRALQAVMLLLVIFLCAGCESLPCQFRRNAEAYTPFNIYRREAVLPQTLKRVAVLPVTVEKQEWQAEEGRASLEAVLHTEIGKSKTFEAVIVTPEQLRDWTGASECRADDRLPGALLSLLREAGGFDGILFTHVRPYHGFRPLKIGWQFKLVETGTKEILWATDEVFDASEPDVAEAARQYWSERADSSRHLRVEDAILSSPRRFSQYTLDSLLATLPRRQ